MKFRSAPIVEHEEAPLADGGRLEDLVAHWERRRPGARSPDAERAAYVVSVGVDRPTDAQLAEIVGLVEARGDHVSGSEIITSRRFDPRTLLGRGACAELAERAVARGANQIVIDAELSPSQMRNLEDATGLPIADREAVILDVFLLHARTRRARIQVEIARLEYLRPRIRGLGLDMDQQMGGVPGGRGPGETASELRARQLDGRLVELRRAFARLRTSGEMQRKRRDACKRIALVGYTNAGKTSLMNAMAKTDLSARDVPFETLDTTSRCLTRHGGEVLLSDTVGFIRRLPASLFDSFESTLSEIRDASLLAIVVDASDPERALHLETTEAMLARIGVGEIPRFYVLNKVDRLASPLTAAELSALSRGHPRAAVSAHDRSAMEACREALIALARGHARREVFVPYARIDVTSAIHGRCRVTAMEPEPTGMRFTVEADGHVLDAIERVLRGRSALSRGVEAPRITASRSERHRHERGGPTRTRGSTE
jgi:GTP-binding protein HflX